MKNDLGIYILAISSIIASFIAYIFILKIPGNIALVPLSIGMLLGLSALILSKYQQNKSSISKVSVILSVIGFAVFFVFTKDAVIIEDEKQMMQQEETSNSIESSDELDNALDDL